MRANERSGVAERSLSEGKRALGGPSSVVWWLIFSLPAVLGFVTFAAEYALLPVPAVLDFYQRHSGLIDMSSIGTVYRSTSNPLYLYFAVYAASLPGIFIASAAVVVPKALHSRSEYFDATRPGKGMFGAAAFFTICAAAAYFTLPKIYTGMGFHFRYDWIRFSPDLLGAFFFACFFWIPAMSWALLLAAVVGRVMQFADHLLWKRDSRRRQRNRILRQEAARRKLHQSHGHDSERPDRG
ncbi:hypothetical protein [Acidimangrovimonas sediminis]|uniref:hypothetical protein n=1 Tax=Acidimangrovimonas sediminis TaxID=2056283 RepID=UPI0011AFB74B|nr:hypothetical protein [Acidimangrovimonas sediminis]